MENVVKQSISAILTVRSPPEPTTRASSTSARKLSIIDNQCGAQTVIIANYWNPIRFCSLPHSGMAKDITLFGTRRNNRTEFAARRSGEFIYFLVHVISREALLNPLGIQWFPSKWVHQTATELVRFARRNVEFHKGIQIFGQIVCPEMLKETGALRRNVDVPKVPPRNPILPDLPDF